MNIAEITVEEFTSPAPVTIPPGARVEDAFELMRRAEVRHLPVEDKGAIVGIISDRDLRPFLARGWGTPITVDLVMQTSVVGVNLNTPLCEAAFVMAHNKVGSLLVMDDASEVVGIFTTVDALNALIELGK